MTKVQTSTTTHTYTKHTHTPTYTHTHTHTMHTTQPMVCAKANLVIPANKRLNPNCFSRSCFRADSFADLPPPLAKNFRASTMLRFSQFFAEEIIYRDKHAQSKAQTNFPHKKATHTLLQGTDLLTTQKGNTHTTRAPVKHTHKSVF